MQIKKVFLALVLLVGMLLPQKLGAQELPIDPEVRMGKLPNGLTYIVRKNQEPQGRANFYIAQKVGSILEDENQLGLAHFLEHMAFNGTKNFPGKDLISFLERIGCRFGADLNAYTAFDETVYTIMDAPTNKGNGIIDSCILILHDWSNNITLDHKEIDEERGVIQEEWRMRNNAQLRSYTNLISQVLGDNKYAKRMPIGTMDVVMNFPYKAIEDFYHKWYRPDQQGIIIVGDLDPDYVVEKIKQYWTDVPAPQNAAERYYVKVEDNKDPIAAIITDKENMATTIQVMYKNDPLPREQRGTIMYALFNYLNGILGKVINDRFIAITEAPNAPMLQAGAFYYNFLGVTATKEAETFVAITKDGEYAPAIKCLAREIKRLCQHGILPGEYTRAKTNLLKGFDDMYKERNKRDSRSYTEEYKDYFLHGGYIPGIKMEKEIMEQLASKVSLEDVNKYIKDIIHADNTNLVITLSGPEKEGLKYPTKEELIKLYTDEFEKSTESNKEKVIDANLIGKELKGGKIISEKKGGKYSTTILKLDNGITVYLKPTDFKDNSISMRALTEGGARLYQHGTYQDWLDSKYIDNALSLGGLGKYDNVELEKALTGRTVSVSASVNDFTSEVSGRSNKEDLETMLQLVYLFMTDVREDQTKADSEIEKKINMLEMAKRNPMFSLQDSLSMLLDGPNAIDRPLKIEDYKKINYKRALQMGRERLASADGFKFFFVGNIDIAAIKPLIVKYLGSLPKGKATPKMDRTTDPMHRKGAKTIRYTKEADNEISVNIDFLSANYPYNLKTKLTAELLNGVLDQVLIASIREKEAGTYSPNALVIADEHPQSTAGIMVQFMSNPGKADHLNEVVYQELNKLEKEGIPNIQLEKTRTNMKKVYGENQRSNNYWMGNLVDFYFFDRNYYDDYMKTLDSITAKDLHEMLSKILKSGNRLELVYFGIPAKKNN